MSRRLRRGRVTPPSDLVKLSFNPETPGWVVDDNYPDEVFVLGSRVGFGAGYTVQMLADRYMALKQGLKEAYPQFIPSAIVAIEPRNAGILMGDDSLRSRLEPFRHAGELRWISAALELGGETVVLRIARRVEYPPVSFLILGHPDLPEDKLGLWY